MVIAVHALTVYGQAKSEENGMKAVTPNQVAEAIARVAHVDWSQIGRDELQQFIDLSPKEAGERLGTFLKNGGVPVVVESKVITTKKDSNLLNPFEYFICRRGLNVSDDFDFYILPGYTEPVLRRGLNLVRHHDFSVFMNDLEIIQKYLGSEEIARGQAFTIDQLAELIERQRNGEKGLLLNNGNQNLFHMIDKLNRLMVVTILWRSNKKYWRVVTYPVGGRGGRWGQGRVFVNTH